MKIKQIRFVLENCETFEISGRNIGWILLDEISETIARTAINYVDEIHYCKRFEIEIFSEADMTYHPFDVEDIEKTVFERLTEGNDITLIEIVWEDDTVNSFRPEWYGESEFSNEGQNGVVSDLGNLYIAINEDFCKRTKSIYDIFPYMDEEETLRNKKMLQHGYDEEPQSEQLFDTVP